VKHLVDTQNMAYVVDKYYMVRERFRSFAILSTIFPHSVLFAQQI
jgi:hypothetical protein